MNWNNVASAMNGDGDVAGALRLIEDAIGRFEELPFTFDLTAAQVFYRAGQVERANRVLIRCASSADTHGLDALYRTATISAVMHQPELAVRLLARWLSIRVGVPLDKDPLRFVLESPTQWWNGYQVPDVMEVAIHSLETGLPMRLLKVAEDDEPLSGDDEAARSEGLDDLENGRVLSHEELRNRLLN
jgi:hypothetical protein